MWFWWFMLLCGAAVPLVMIVGGWAMWRHCPKKINCWYGYRTARSMQNQDTWQFAHAYCGRLWWLLGWGALLPCILIFIPLYGTSEGSISAVGLILMTAQLFLLFYSIFLTEKALKEKFKSGSDN